VKFPPPNAPPQGEVLLSPDAMTASTPIRFSSADPSGAVERPPRRQRPPTGDPTPAARESGPMPDVEATPGPSPIDDDRPLPDG
jgi:hypothetical protein